MTFYHWVSWSFSASLRISWFSALFAGLADLLPAFRRTSGSSARLSWISWSSALFSQDKLIFCWLLIGSANFLPTPYRKSWSSTSFSLDQLFYPFPAGRKSRSPTSFSHDQLIFCQLLTGTADFYPLLAGRADLLSASHWISWFSTSFLQEVLILCLLNTGSEDFLPASCRKINLLPASHRISWSSVSFS